MTFLRLSAFDQEDLEIISAHLQDALLKVKDMTYLPRQHRFALVANRFVEAGAKGGERRLTGVQFSHVLSVKSQRVRLGAKEAVLSLLAIQFTASDTPPEGQIELVFSGGGSILLQVDCIEISMEDLTEGRATSHIPRHNLDDAP